LMHHKRISETLMTTRSILHPAGTKQ
jgi:hypothetical protein